MTPLKQESISSKLLRIRRNVKELEQLGKLPYKAYVQNILHTSTAERLLQVSIEAMLDIGRRYFGLGNVKRLALVHRDARQYVTEAAKRKKQFDLIITDLFFGREIPDFVSSHAFLRQLQQILKKDGALVINYLRESEYGKRSDSFMEMLQTIFAVVQDFSLYHNRFFNAR